MKHKIGIFPCKQCLLISCCTKLCEKITNMNNRHITRVITHEDRCPDCGIDNIKESRHEKYHRSNRYLCKNCNHNFIELYRNNIIRGQNY